MLLRLEPQQATRRSPPSLPAADISKPSRTVQAIVSLKNISYLASLLPKATLQYLLLFKKKEDRQTIKDNKSPNKGRREGQCPLLGLTDASSLLLSSGPQVSRPHAGGSASAIGPLCKGSACPCPPTPVSSFEALSHIGQGDREGLHG